MGTWQEDIQHPLGSREPMPLGVQGRPVTISQNKPNLSHYKALCARRLFVQRPHIVPIFGTSALKLQRYWIPPGPSRLCMDSRQHADIQQLAVDKVQWNKNTKPRKRKNTLTNERNTKNFLKVRRLRNDSVFISGPVKLLSRRERIQRTSDNK